MPIESVLPKYALIVNTIQARIEDGTYPPGSTLPSETALIKEFHVSRPTVVRSLEMLRQQGWIDAHHGRGRTVRSRRPQEKQRASDGPYPLLDGVEQTDVRVLSAGPVPAPPRAAALLHIDIGDVVIARRRLVVAEAIGPVELSTAYVPEALAAGTVVGDPAPLREGLLTHLARRKDVTFDHVVERISARLPTAEEMELLQIGERDSLLTSALAVCDRAGQPLIALDILLPGTRHELEDVFSL
ncbi:GntR family transcriptional regulator [Dactylosporangium sp. NPDC000555]|uniref:GntR family transcriptional regulator n=1 Tax=Dactylosporangium sp. NPDC000555 TaxID=3154260 RepID=UPI00331EEBF9